MKRPVLGAPLKASSRSSEQTCARAPVFVVTYAHHALIKSVQTGKAPLPGQNALAANRLIVAFSGTYPQDRFEV